MPQRLTGVNWHAWLGRLGIKNPRQPDLSDTAYPCVLVADHTQLVAPLRGPVGHCGFVRANPPAANFAGIEVCGGGDGGTYVSLNLSNSAALVFAQYGFSPVPMTLGTVLSPSISFEDPRFPNTCTVRQGYNPARNLAADVWPMRATGGAGNEFVGGPIECYLPPGRFLWVEAYSPASGWEAAIVLRDVPGAVDHP